MPEIAYNGPDPAEAAWSRALLYADRLFDALEELDELRGGGAVVAGWKTGTLDKAIASLEAARVGIEAPLAKLRARREADRRRQQRTPRLGNLADRLERRPVRRI